MSQRISIDPTIEDRCGAGGAVEIDGRIFVSGLSGDGDTATAQFSGAVDHVRDALARLGSSLDDVVRTRVFYTEPSDLDSLGLAHGIAFQDIRPAMSVTQVHFLPYGVKSLLEAEAVRGSASLRVVRAFDMPNAARWGYSGAVRVGDDIWVSGVTTLQASGECLFAGDLSEQALWITGKIGSMIGSLGGRRTDIVSTRHYTNVAYVGTSTVPERLGLMHPHHPTSAGITVQGVGDRRLGELIEAEAVVGATEARRNLNSGRPYEEDHHYCRSVAVGNVVYVSGTTSAQLDESVGSPFDAYGQTLQTLDWIRWGVENQGFSLSDIVRTRTYLVGQENTAPVARGLKEALGGIQPTSTVVGVPALGRPGILVEIEATAVRDGNAE